MRKGEGRKRTSQLAVEKYSLAVDSQTKQPRLEVLYFKSNFTASSNLIDIETTDIQATREVHQAVHFPEPPLPQWMS